MLSASARRKQKSRYLKKLRTERISQANVLVNCTPTSIMPCSETRGEWGEQNQHLNEHSSHDMTANDNYSSSDDFEMDTSNNTKSNIEDTVDFEPCFLRDDIDVALPKDTNTDVTTQETIPLRKQLADWALQHNIPHIALNSLLSIVKPHFADLPKDARSLLRTTSSITTTMKSSKGTDGQYCYFGIANGLTIQLQRELNVVNSEISLLFNVDGLPLFKSSQTQFWPILCKLDVADASPFAVAIYCGNSKPESVDVYCKDFVEELNYLLAHGMVYNNKLFNIKLMAIVCDAPARAFLKCVKGHTGYYGCERCTQKGQNVANRTVFLQTDSEERTDASFLAQRQAQHHTAVSPLTYITDMGMVTKFPLDYMHLVCLGVCRRLLMMLTSAKLGQNIMRLRPREKNELSDAIKSFSKNIPCEFQRKATKGVDEIDRWKATEFRLFVAYIGPLVLKEFLKEDHYHHFLLLHVAMRLLLSPEVTLESANDAKGFLVSFVDAIPALYGEKFLSYNMHSLIHLADDVINMGSSLDRMSCFPFENYLGSLKKLLRTPNKPLSQICRRLSEMNQNMANTSRKYETVLSGQYFVGPLGAICGQHYRSLQTNKMKLSVGSDRDNHVMLSNAKVLQIENIVETANKDIYLVGHTYENYRSTFQYPCSSSELQIHKISNISRALSTWKFTDAIQKCMVLKTNHYSIAMPLLH